MKKSMTVSKKTTKRALWMNVLSLILCFTMLVSTTFAWFTDSVTSGKNQIIAGNLDVEVTHVNAKVTTAESIQDAMNLWNKDADGNDILWEPGVVSYETFTVKNAGDMALTYKLLLNKLVEADYNTIVSTDDSNGKSLKDVLYIHTVTGAASATRPETKMAEDDKTIAELLSTDAAVLSGSLEAGASSDALTVYIYWPTDSGNECNLQNGKYASDATAETVGKLWIDLSVTATAAQYTSESDSFDNQYDKTAGIGTKFTVTVNYSQDGNAPTATTQEVPSGTTIAAADKVLTIGEGSYTSSDTAPDGDFRYWEYSVDGGSTYKKVTDSITVTSDMTIRAGYGYVVELEYWIGTSENPEGKDVEIICPEGTTFTADGLKLILKNKNGDEIYTAETISSYTKDSNTFKFRNWYNVLVYNGNRMYVLEYPYGDVTDKDTRTITSDVFICSRHSV